MTQESIVGERLYVWQLACQAWGFEIDPPLVEEVLEGTLPGVVSIHAERVAAVKGVPTKITLDVHEFWQEGEDPWGEKSLEEHGCYAAAVNWHAQVGPTTGHPGAERLDAVPPDSTHPHIHRHPHGETNDVRYEVNFPVPFVWLSDLNDVLGGRL